eukprot:13936-Amphidinium_carterae.1
MPCDGCSLMWPWSRLTGAHESLPECSTTQDVAERLSVLGFGLTGSSKAGPGPLIDEFGPQAEYITAGQKANI